MYKNKLLHLTITGFCLLIASPVFSQSTINVASHSATINNIKFDYSIGEMTLVSTERNSNLIITQGFLQPEIGKGSSSNAGNNGLADWITKLKVFPNPTDNVLFLELTELNTNTYHTQICDAAGKTISTSTHESKIGLNQFSFDVSSLATGTYFLIISKPDETKTSFKIQKTSK